MATQPDQPASEYHYWAFISYSHADEKWADWLHKALETYGVPKVLVGKPSKHGPVPKRAFPVFRDRDELPSSADLGDKLTAALRQSRFLIVVCSPRAVASKWVNEEVKTFKSLGREDRVLCLIVDGEPYASDHPEWGLEECFPEPVRYHVDSARRVTGDRTEPIAADARKGKDGRANARLKLLAGMFGVNFSDLKQRDVERAQRRTQVILSAVMILFAVFVVLGIQLYFEKNKAEQARIEAERQKEYAVASEKRAKDAAKQALKAQADEAKARQAAEKAKEDAQAAEKQALAAKEQEEQAKLAAQAAEKKALAAQAEEAKQRQAAQESERKAVAARAEEAKQRQAAVVAQKLAEANEKRALRALSVSDFNEATGLIEEKNEAVALAYLARAISLSPDNTSAQARLLSVLEESNWSLPRVEPLVHAAPLSAASFSSDGKWVITLAGNTVQVWDAATGERVGKAITGRYPIRHAEFSPDGKWVVTASEDGSARVWESATGNPIGKPLSHGREVVNYAAFSPDSKWVVTASQDKTAVVWDVASGDKVAGPIQHGNRVEMAVFSPDGKVVATASENAARFWDAAKGTPVGEPMSHAGGVFTLAFSVDGSRLATGSGDKTARVWEVPGGKAIAGPFSHDDQVLYVDFSPDSKYVLTASRDRTARVWEAASGSTQVGKPLQHGLPVNSIMASPNAKWLVTASDDGTARVWELATGKTILEPIKLNGAVKTAQFSRDGSRVVVASADKTAQIWTVVSGKPVVEPFRHDHFVNWAGFSPDGKRVVTASDDRTARVWDVATGKPVTDLLRHDNRVLYASFSPDGKRVVTGSEDRKTRVWDITTGKVVVGPMDHDSWVTMATFSPDGRYILTASQDRTARVWDAATGKPAHDKPLSHASYVSSAYFSADGKWILTASIDKTAKVWETATGKPLHEGFKHQGEIRHAEFSRDGKWVATASEDRTARVWETTTGKPVTEPLRHEGPVNWVCFDPEGKFLVTASQDKTARVWRPDTGQPAAEPLKHEAEVKSAVFSPNGQLLVTCSREKFARVWESSSWKLVSEPLQHDGLIRAANFSANGSYLVTASDDKTVRVWLMSLPGETPPWLPELAETVGGYRMAQAGGAELVKDTWKRLTAIRAQLAAAPADDPAADWGRWFLAERGTRTISSYARISVKDYINQRLAEGTAASLQEILDIQPNHGLALARLAHSLVPADLNGADFYSRLAAQYEPGNPDVLWLRADVMQKRNQFEPAYEVMKQAVALDPRCVTTFGPAGRQFELSNREGQVSKGWLPKGWEDANRSLATSVKYTKLDDPPPGASTAIRVEVTGTTRVQAQLGGPRGIARFGGKLTVEGFYRSSKTTDLSVVARQFLPPNEEFAKQTFRSTGEWKPFKMPIKVPRDLAAEVIVFVPTDGVMDLADVRIHSE